MSVPYVVVVHLLPQDATLDEWMFAAKTAYERRQSLVMSADDAKRLCLEGQPGSKVLVWEPQRWPAGNIADWLQPCHSEAMHFPQSTPVLVQIWPNYAGFQQHNTFMVQRMHTSQADADEARGWPA